MIGQIAGAVFFAGAARAEDAALEPGRHAETPLAQRALRLSLGTGLTFGLSDVETQQSDVVEMSSSAWVSTRSVRYTLRSPRIFNIHFPPL